MDLRLGRTVHVRVLIIVDCKMTATIVCAYLIRLLK
jgi:hypothetical protein